VSLLLNLQSRRKNNFADFRSRYYHYVNTIVDPLYLDNLKLLGWDYINYIEGWPVLSYD